MQAPGAVMTTAAPQKEVRPMKVFAIQVFDVEKVIAALYLPRLL
jgi:hypothetical protein